MTIWLPRKARPAGFVALTAVLLTTTAVAGPAAADTTPVKAGGIVLVLDASGSMNEPDGHGSTKIAAAKAAVKSIVGQLPTDLPVGLRVYGHRVPSKPDHAKACQDTQLIAPVATGNRPALTAAVDKIAAKGETPIGLSLQKAAADLPPGVAGSVILVSDGEDSCALPAPCDVAKQLAATGVQLTVNTVGLKVDAKARGELTCISQATGGSYTDVQDTAKLASTLTEVATRDRRVAGAVTGGTPVQGGPSREQAPTLTPGTYHDTLLGKEFLYYAISLEGGKTATARVTFDAGAIKDSGIVSTTWQDRDGERPPLQGTTFENACCFAGKRRSLTVTLETADYSGKPAPGTYYLELHQDQAITQEMPILIEISTADAATTGTASPPPAASAGTGPTAAPSSPAASAPAGPATPSAARGANGYSLVTVTAGVVGGLVVGLLGGALLTFLAMRRSRGRNAAPTTPPPGSYPPAGNYPPPENYPPPRP